MVGIICCREQGRWMGMGIIGIIEKYIITKGYGYLQK